MFYRKCGNDRGKTNLNLLYKRTYTCRHPKNSRNQYILEILFRMELGNDFESVLQIH